tara:strand:- start:2384 stop:3817 length:1434 start_codon:yes stop_codon:yes gene_type:complete
MTYRLPTSELVLPNDSNSIRMPVNTVADNIMFNSKIKLLDENFNYLLESATVVDNRSPQAYKNIYNPVTNTWQDVSVLPTPIDHGYNHIEVIDRYNGQYLYILAQSDSIGFFVGGDLSADDTSQLDSKVAYFTVKDTGNQVFKNISSVVVEDDKLYVYDSVYQAMVVYDITALLVGDVVLEQIKLINHFTQIKDMKAMAITATSYYTVQSSTMTLYNRDFNVINTIDLENTTPNDVITEDGFIYVLYDDKIDVYNTSMVFQRTNIIRSIDDNAFFKLFHSIKDDNIVYVLTASHVYKYLITDDVFVSYFKLSLERDKDYVDISIKEHADYDEVFILDTNKIHYTQDNVTTVDMHDTFNMNDIVDLDQLQIENLELEQDFVYNAVLQQLLFNTLLLYNSLIFKPIVQTDMNGVLEYSHRLNLSNSDVLAISASLMGQNEPFSYQLFLKALQNIFDIQTKIIELEKFNVIESSTNTLII